MCPNVSIAELLATFQNIWEKRPENYLRRKLFPESGRRKVEYLAKEGGFTETARMSAFEEHVKLARRQNWTMK